jgi:hypothetical protein
MATSGGPCLSPELKPHIQAQPCALQTYKDSSAFPATSSSRLSAPDVALSRFQPLMGPGTGGLAVKFRQAVLVG